MQWDYRKRFPQRRSSSASVAVKQPSAQTFAAFDGASRVADFVARINQQVFQAAMILFLVPIQFESGFPRCLPFPLRHGVNRHFPSGRIRPYWSLTLCRYWPERLECGRIPSSHSKYCLSITDESTALAAGTEPLTRQRMERWIPQCQPPVRLLPHFTDQHRRLDAIGGE